MENLGNILIPLLITIITICICIMTSKVAKDAVRLAPSKYSEIIYALENIVNKAVITTNQTFVNELKKQGKFDKKAMEEAYNKTFNSIVESLSQSFFEYIDEEAIDIDMLLKNMIETSVNWNKITVMEPVEIEYDRDRISRTCNANQ